MTEADQPDFAAVRTPAGGDAPGTPAGTAPNQEAAAPTDTLDLDHDACYRALATRDARFDGRLFTAREGVYKRAVEDRFGLPASPDELGRANFHCSPAASIGADGSMTVGAVTATASFRFAKYLDGWFEVSHCNVIIGKAGMTSEVYRRSFVPNNAIYLTTVG